MMPCSKQKRIGLRRRGIFFSHRELDAICALQDLRCRVIEVTTVGFIGACRGRRGLFVVSIAAPESKVLSKGARGLDFFAWASGDAPLQLQSPRRKASPFISTLVEVPALL